MMSDELMNMTSRYKFAIAFENAICEDYITEKLWRPLIAGTVPIYVGSPSIRVSLAEWYNFNLDQYGLLQYRVQYSWRTHLLNC